MFIAMFYHEMQLWVPKIVGIDIKCCNFSLGLFEDEPTHPTQKSTTSPRGVVTEGLPSNPVTL